MIRKALAFAIGFGLLSSASAVEWSAGGGAFFGNNFGGGVKLSVPFLGTLLEVTTPYAGGGFYGFLDAQYVEVSAGLMFCGGKTKVKGDLFFDFDDDDFWDDDDDFWDDDIEFKTSGMLLNIGVLAKYPIAKSESMTFFPAAGIEYSVCLSQKLEDIKNDDAGDHSRLWFKFGGGADFALGEKAYLRTTLLYGIGLKNKAEKDIIDETGGMLSAVMSHGLDIKVGVGFKF